jgi:hypothetical protein
LTLLAMPVWFEVILARNASLLPETPVGPVGPVAADPVVPIGP